MMTNVFSKTLVLLLLSYCGIASARYIQSDPVGLEGGLNTHAYVDSNPVDSSDPDGLQKRSSGNPRQMVPVPGQGSTWLGQQGVWYRGQFYVRFGPSISVPPPSASLNYCPIPPVGSSPTYGGGRTNTTGTGSPYTVFTQNTAAGPMTIGTTASGGTRISGPGATGGTTQIRINLDGSVRVDIVPGQGSVPTTVHFPPPK
jgi:hypothetical protein